MEFAFLPGEAHDTRGLKALSLNLPSKSTVYADSGYTDYHSEDLRQEMEQINLAVIRKRNSRRPDSPCAAFIKQHLRHPIETLFSLITRWLPRKIHAVNMDGFLLKIFTAIFCFTLEAAFLP